MKIKFGSFEFEVDEPSDLFPIILPIVGAMTLVAIALIEIFGGK